jgi:hypothetical protein
VLSARNTDDAKIPRFIGGGGKNKRIFISGDDDFDSWERKVFSVENIAPNRTSIGRV